MIEVESACPDAFAENVCDSLLRIILVAESPLFPCKANEYEKYFVNVFPSTVIGIVNVPFLVVINDVTVGEK